ncbi:cytochrome c1 [Thiocapsa marina]|uniref:Cytochrome c1 n=1 Tax=Thiocapsa marina 5811 TaxID=768671 RepID=F9U6H8_9GAMM|nr:cytochrome c1 [Thiocapsa marina]EGV19854.1 cytochrome c1 [Thiocapsa marina 5811]
MRKLIIATLALLLPAVGFAAGGHVELEKADIDLNDQASLQRGAKYYVNYCMACHSLKHMRYSRMADDLGIDDKALRENLLFGDAQPTSMMTNSMRPADGEVWFGTAVPDLTLVTRWRSPDWVYTYLKSFYSDPTRPYGVNNVIFPLVGMPHVLGDLQGVQEAIVEEHAGHEPTIAGVELTQPGSLAPEEYDNMVRDITAFLAYAGEPSQMERRKVGIYVLLFLGLFFIVAFALKKEYWKDVH